MKNKKILIIIVIAIITIISGTIIYLNKNNSKKQEETLNNYISLINEQKYEEMYDMLSEKSKSEISKEDFITRNIIINNCC